MVPLSFLLNRTFFCPCHVKVSMSTNNHTSPIIPIQLFSFSDLSPANLIHSAANSIGSSVLSSSGAKNANSEAAGAAPQQWSAAEQAAEAAAQQAEYAWADQCKDIKTCESSNSLLDPTPCQDQADKSGKQYMAILKGSEGSPDTCFISDDLPKLCSCKDDQNECLQAVKTKYPKPTVFQMGEVMTRNMECVANLKTCQDHCSAKTYKKGWQLLT